MKKLSENALRNILEVSASSKTKNLPTDTLKELAELAGVTTDSVQRDYQHFKKIAETDNDDIYPLIG